jgi:hypothetical protein
MEKSYHIQPITMVRLTFKQVGLEGKSYQIQPITMVRLTITRWEVLERVIRFSL